MHLYFGCIVAMFLIFVSTFGAPTWDSPDDSCIDIQSSSFELSKIANILSLETRVGIPNISRVSNSIPWLEVKDNCDPSSLRIDPMPCIMKIADALKSYHSAVETVGKQQICPGFANFAKIKPALKKVSTDLKKCVKLTRGIHLKEESHITSSKLSQEEDSWDAANLCHYVMERLSSFSIFMARVFALGDPAKHIQDPVKCM